MNKPKVKKVSITTLENKADGLWSLAVRKIGYCQHCGKVGGKLDPHHIFSRSNKSTRWDMVNGICLCSGCHTLSSSFSAHKTPTEFTYWLEQQRGRKWLEDLGRKAHTPVKVTREFLEEQIETLKTMI